MVRRALAIIAVGVASLGVLPASAVATLTSRDDSSGLLTRGRVGSDFVEARQYRLPDARIAGHESARQSVAAWQVVHGSWNGESLDGLSLVLVQTTSDDGRALPATNCYISHLATPAQRSALISAYFASQDLKSADVAGWRYEPAVITFEFIGPSVILHLGLIA